MRTPAAAGAQRHAALAVLFIGALLLRVAYVGSIEHAYFFDHLQTEPERYQQWAMLILRAPHPPPPPYDEPPGYAFSVAALYALGGIRTWPVAAAQCVLDAASCMMIALIGCRCWSARAGIIAGAWAAVYGPLIYFTGELLPTTLFIFLTVAATLMGIGSERRAGRWFGSGLLWSAALLVRAEAFIGLPFVCFDAWRRGGRAGAARIAAPMIATIVAVAAINFAFSRQLILSSTTGGLNLWLGNNPHSDGVNPFIYGPLQAVADGVRRAAHRVSDADRMFLGYAIEFWHEQPAAAGRLLLKKLAWTWTDRELPNTSDIDWELGQSWLFAHALRPLSFGVLLPVAAAGLVLGFGRLRRPSAMLPVFAIGALTPLLFFTNARFRIVMLPALLVLAGVAVDALLAWRRVPHPPLTRLLAAMLAAVAAIVVAWSNPYDVRAYRVPQIAVNTGIMEREAGRLDAAVRHLRDGLAGDPSDGLAWAHLALALEQQGELTAALQAYLQGLRAAPADPDLRQLAARFFGRHHVDDGAIRDYLAAPDDAARAAATLRAAAPLNAR